MTALEDSPMTCSLIHNLPITPVPAIFYSALVKRTLLEVGGI